MATSGGIQWPPTGKVFMATVTALLVGAITRRLRAAVGVREATGGARFAYPGSECCEATKAVAGTCVERS